ncbi:MAG TPA: hypothetical protein VF297_10160 [Pyrinomonadaceae bacterium]
MKRKLFLLTLLACAALTLARASARGQQQTTNTMPKPPQEQHVIASPNPTVDDSKTTTLVEPGKVTGTRVQPATTTTSAPMKKATRPKRKRKSR